jgi:hypothetical protein
MRALTIAHEWGTQKVVVEMQTRGFFVCGPDDKQRQKQIPPLRCGMTKDAARPE